MDRAASRRTDLRTGRSPPARSRILHRRAGRSAARPVEGVGGLSRFGSTRAPGWARRRFRWHPSGTALYVQTESNGVYNLWKVRVDPRRSLWVSAERLTTGAGPDVAPAVSRDGTRLAFSTEQGAHALVGVPARSRRAPPRLRKAADGGRRDRQLAALSPDGQSVAYNLKRPGIDRDELWITHIVEGRASWWRPTRFSRAGRQMERRLRTTTFDSTNSRSPGAVAVRQLGGKERFISRWSTDWFLPSDWSAERGLLGYLRDSCLRSIAVGTLADDESGCRQAGTGADLQAGNGFLAGGKFSPNGRWLSFVA